MENVLTKEKAEKMLKTQIMISYDQIYKNNKLSDVQLESLTKLCLIVMRYDAIKNKNFFVSLKNAIAMLDL
jgi:hypothetical protein